MLPPAIGLATINQYKFSRVRQVHAAIVQLVFLAFNTDLLSESESLTSCRLLAAAACSWLLLLLYDTSTSLTLVVTSLIFVIVNVVVLKMATRKVNNNVSTSAVSRSEKVIISELVVVNESDAPKKPGVRCNSSFVWQYYGALHRKLNAGNSDLALMDNERSYCR